MVLGGIESEKKRFFKLKIVLTDYVK